MNHVSERRAKLRPEGQRGDPISQPDVAGVDGSGEGGFVSALDDGSTVFEEGDLVVGIGQRDSQQERVLGDGPGLAQLVGHLVERQAGWFQWSDLHGVAAAEDC